MNTLSGSRKYHLIVASGFMPDIACIQALNDFLLRIFKVHAGLWWLFC